MDKKQITGYLKTETVIGLVAVSLLIGFVSGVAFGIYKSGTIVDPHASQVPPAMDAQKQESIDTLLAKARENPEDSQVWVQLGHLYFDADLPEESIGAYEKALSIQPQNADVWTDLGVMYRRSGKPEKAVEAFDKAMEIDETHEISRFNKGVVLFHDLKEEAEALEAWESLLSINPDAKSPGGQTVRELVDHIKQKHQDTE